MFVLFFFFFLINSDQSRLLAMCGYQSEPAGSNVSTRSVVNVTPALSAAFCTAHFPPAPPCLYLFIYLLPVPLLSTAQTTQKQLDSVIQTVYLALCANTVVAQTAKALREATTSPRLCRKAERKSCHVQAHAFAHSCIKLHSYIYFWHPYVSFTHRFLT